MPKSDIRICFFNTTQAWGGGEKWHFEMASALFQEGYRVVFVCHKKSVLAQKLAETAIPTRIFSINNLSFLNIVTLIRLKRFFGQMEVSALIMNLSADLKVAGVAAKWAGVKKIIYRRGSAIPIKDKFLNRFLFGSVLTHVIANSQATQKTILENNPNLFPKEKIRVIYNGLPLNRILDNPFPLPFQARKSEIILGNVGRMVYQKGHKLLIEVARQLKAEGLKFRLLLAGSGALESDIRKQVIDYGLEEEVIFLGFVSDIPHFMASLDIFLLSSRWEGFGFVLAEAMAAGKAIVGFDISSNPELVYHGKNGFLAKAFDTAEFSSYTMQLARDKTLRDTFGKQGLELVREKFTFDRSVKEFKALLNE